MDLNKKIGMILEPQPQPEDGLAPLVALLVALFSVPYEQQTKEQRKSFRPKALAILDEMQELLEKRTYGTRSRDTV